jgi:hypothetical protein
MVALVFHRLSFLLIIYVFNFFEIFKNFQISVFRKIFSLMCKRKQKSFEIFSRDLLQNLNASYRVKTYLATYTGSNIGFYNALRFSSSRKNTLSTFAYHTFFWYFV